MTEATANVMDDEAPLTEKSLETLLDTIINKKLKVLEKEVYKYKSLATRTGKHTTKKGRFQKNSTGGGEVSGPSSNPRKQKRHKQGQHTKTSGQS